MSDAAERSSRRRPIFERLRGLWRSHAYGLILDIGADRYQLCEETRVSCLCLYEGSIEELDAFYADCRVSAQGRAFSVRRATGVTRLRFRRLLHRPASCDASSPRTRTDPAYNFEVFWHTFAERYALFELRGVDWHATRARYLQQVVPETPPERLFEVFSAMLEPLRDGHVELRASCGRMTAGVPSSVQSRIASREGLAGDDPRAAGRVWELAERADALIRERYLGELSHSAAAGRVEWGRLDEATGYLCLRSMAGHSGAASRPHEDQAVAARAVERALRDLGSLPAIALDLRRNLGGYDGVALRIAGYFIDRRRLAFVKCASKRFGYGGKQRIMIEPRGPRRYAGRVYLLTSGLTTSAAEIFVLALLERPRLTRIGEATHGELSDMMERHLPNGWTITLSNELYLASDGEVYEGRGVPPHEEIRYLDPRDVEARLDPMLERVLERSGER